MSRALDDRNAVALFRTAVDGFLRLRAGGSRVWDRRSCGLAPYRAKGHAHGALKMRHITVVEHCQKGRTSFGRVTTPTRVIILLSAVQVIPGVLYGV